MLVLNSTICVFYTRNKDKDKDKTKTKAKTKILFQDWVFFLVGAYFYTFVLQR